MALRIFQNHCKMSSWLLKIGISSEIFKILKSIPKNLIFFIGFNPSLADTESICQLPFFFFPELPMCNKRNI